MLKILIVEDDLMLADMLEDELVAIGYAVCGIARNVSDGVTLGRLHKPNLALIDMRLEGAELGTDVASQLRDLPGLGILYASGNCPQVLREARIGHACLAKPYSNKDLKRALEIVTEMVATGKVTAPLPSGFRVLKFTTPGLADSRHE